MGTRFGGWLVAAAAAVALLGASIAPFLTPAVVRFEQDRTGVAESTGYTRAELDTATSAILADLVLWRGEFTVALDGEPVLNTREREHMLDVRGVFIGLWILVAAGAVVLAVTFRRGRGTETRAAAWRAVAGGARALAIVIAVVGAFAVFAFDAAFEVFHRLFFSSGSYTFDPATDRLVQLFPQQFWSDVSIAVGVVVLGASILTAWLAGRRARRVSAPESMRVLTTWQAPT